MKIFKFKAISAYTTFFSVLLTIVIGLYTFIPQVVASLSPINRQEIEILLKNHGSFVNDRNIEGMLSLYHPNFSMDVIHSTGRKESFDKSQMLKHQENLDYIVSMDIELLSQQISIIDKNQALVSIVMRQKHSIKNLPLTDSKFLHQTMLIKNHNRKPKILKALSWAMNEKA